MKTLIVFIISFAFFSPCFSQQNLRLAFPDEITYRGDMAYFHDSPFTGLLVDKKTNRQLGEFRNGYKNGAFIEYFSNGKKEVKIEFLNGLKEGTQTEWFENGNKKAKTIFKNGVINGISIKWYLNGQKKSSYNYNNGDISDGKYVTYLENGQIVKEEIYRNGQIISTGKYIGGKLSELSKLSAELYPNSRKKSEGHLKNGKKDGFWTEWYENGRKKSEGNYINEKQEGQWITWFENGEIEFEGNYVDGKRNGKGTLNSKYKGNIINYIGYFVNNRYEGKGKMVIKKPDGSMVGIVSGEYKNDTIFNGTIRLILSTGTIISEVKDGKTGVFK